jgi:hypothetical protein
MSDLTALGLQAALVAAIYWPTYRLQFVSDSWVFLDRLRQGFWPAVSTPTGYHWQPVAVAWVALLRGTFGERPALFQAVNLAQLTLLGYLTYLMGRRVLPDSRGAILASLLVVGSASFYEATYWPLNGNLHMLGHDLYLLAVILAHDVALGRLGRGGPWLLGFTALAAVFSHPAMITAVPVCALTVLVVGRDRADSEPPRPARRSKRTAFVLLLAVAALFGVARMAFSASFGDAPKPGLDAERMFLLVQRGLIGLFTLQGSPLVVDKVMTLGILPPLGTLRLLLFVVSWLVAALAAAALILWRARTSGVRLLIGFLGIHLAALTLATPATPRQLAVPAVPAALLTVWALGAVAGRLAGKAPTAAWAAVWRAAPAALVLLLVLGAQADHRTALRLNLRAGDAVRALVARIRAVAPPGQEPVDLMLVNMPSITIDRRMHAWVFANGLEELAYAASPAVGSVEVRQMPGWGPTDLVAPRIRRLSPVALRAQLADPYRVLLLFEGEPLGVRTMTAEDVHRFAPGPTLP